MILNPRLIIPESFEACLTYEQQIAYLAKWCGELADSIGGSGSPEIEELKQRVSALEAEDANISAQIEEISAQLQTLQESLNKKQDELTFDSTPTAGSNNPVTSDGIKKYVDNAVAGGGGTITIDPVPTENSPNAVQSGGTYSAIQEVRATAEAAQSAASAASTAAASATEAANAASTAASQAQTAAETAQETANTAQQTATTAQTAAGTAQETAEAANTAAGNAASTAAAATQTAGAAQTAATQAQQTAAAASTAASEAQETAEAASSAASTAQSTAEQAQTAAETAQSAAEAAQSAATQAQQTADAKQDELTFDTTPTAGSGNPVTSGGIKTYVDNAVSGGGGGGGGELAGPLRGVRAGDLTYYVDPEGWVQQMDYNHDCYLFRPSSTGNATLILDGATWDSGMSVSHYATVHMPLSVDGNPFIITGGSNGANGFIGINKGVPTWAAALMTISPHLFGTILRVPNPRLVSFSATQAQYRELYAEVQEDNKFHIGFRDAETVTLPNTYTIYASNGFAVFAYRSGFVDVLDPGTFAVVQSVAVPAGQTPVHLAHIGTHLYLMCEGACYKARSGIAKLGTFEQVFASTYPTSGATPSGNYGAGPDWVSLNENGGYSLITEEALTYNIMKTMVQGMTAYYNTADEAGHVETPDGVTLPIGNTGYSLSVMFPALRFI